MALKVGNPWWRSQKSPCVTGEGDRTSRFDGAGHGAASGFSRAAQRGVRELRTAPAAARRKPQRGGKHGVRPGPRPHARLA